MARSLFSPSDLLALKLAASAIAIGQVKDLAAMC